MAVLEIKKFFLVIDFQLKNCYICFNLKAKKKAVTDEVGTPIPTSSTKRYLAEYRLAVLQRFITIKVR